MKIKTLILIIIQIFSVNVLLSQRNFSNEWITHFEKSNYLETPRYKETIDYFKKFEKHSPYAKLISFGRSPEGRELFVLIASKDKQFNPLSAQKSGKVILMIQNGIHSGEIDGKDASMILLRDILVTKEKFHYLDNVILMVIPVFNVDGHERFSPFNRINQNGPKEMGWRVNSLNLNLNRDYMKADSPEMKAWLKLFNAWQPDMFVDCHVTNGADYQYTMTYAIEKDKNVHPILGEWVKKSFIPYFENEVEKDGFLIAPYVWFRGDEIKKGIVDGATGPRLSNGYTAIRNKIALLLETHMLKDYKSRVFATYSALDVVIRKINSESKKVKEIVRKAEEQSLRDFIRDKKAIPLKYQTEDEGIPFIFKGINYRKEPSEISGKEKIVYTDEKSELEVPLFNNVRVVDSVEAPFAYFIPTQFKEIIDVMKLHGIKLHRLTKEIKLKVEKYKFDETPVWQRIPYESRIAVSAKYNSFFEEVIIPEGTYAALTDQLAFRVLVNLLEPKAPDSFVYWGFFNSIFERKEYFEDYVMEKYALEMIESDPNLKISFSEKINSDSSFANNPYKRLEYFYRLSPYYDQSWNVYPIMRLNEKIELKSLKED
ncbi:MAG: peptidase M14 [Ignavibacteria bacterium]|nr:peptidase M14 [Ignavibacteria bacterium]